jgi:large subunit ribosomal protein L4
MATLDVLNQAGERVDSIELSDAVFAAPVREYLLWEVVKAQLASRRRGTHCTKTRTEVQGSTRKLYRQKGTGRARHGSIRAGTYVGGGVTFGPKPRSYDYRPPKKVRKNALRCALSLRTREKKLLVLQNLDLAQIKTKQVAALLKKLGVARGLLVDDRGNLNLIKSVRNLPRSKYLAPEGLNVYDVLLHETLIVSAPAVKKIEERLLP